MEKADALTKPSARFSSPAVDSGSSAAWMLRRDGDGSMLKRAACGSRRGLCLVTMC